MALYDGKVADRFARMWGMIADSRKLRGLDQRETDRIAREFVDPATGVSATGKTSAQKDELYEEAFGS